MCMDPITMLNAAGGGLGMFGSIAGGQANSQMAGMAAQAAEMNARTALDFGEGKATQIGQRTQMAIGAARTHFGAGNIDVNSGSPLLLQAMSAQQGNTDKQLAIAGGLTQASGQSFAAGQDLMRQNQSLMAGYFGAGTALLHGLGGDRGLGGMNGGGSDWAPYGMSIFAGN